MRSLIPGSQPCGWRIAEVPKCKRCKRRGSGGEDFVKWWDTFVTRDIYRDFYNYLVGVGPYFCASTCIHPCMHAYIHTVTYIHTYIPYHTIPYHTITFQYISVHFSTFHYITLQYSTYTHIMYNIYIIIYQYVHVYTLVYISLSWIPGRQWLRLHRSARGLRGPPRGGRGARGARGHAKGAACREDRDGWALNM